MVAVSKNSFFCFQKQQKVFQTQLKVFGFLFLKQIVENRKRKTGQQLKLKTSFLCFQKQKQKGKKTSAQPIKCTVLHPNFEPYQQHARVVVFISLFFLFFLSSHRSATGSSGWLARVAGSAAATILAKRFWTGETDKKKRKGEEAEERGGRKSYSHLFD